MAFSYQQFSQKNFIVDVPLRIYLACYRCWKYIYWVVTIFLIGFFPNLSFFGLTIEVRRLLENNENIMSKVYIETYQPTKMELK